MRDKVKKKHGHSGLFPKATERLRLSSIFDSIQYDPVLSEPNEWRKLQIQDQARWTRRYLLPILKIFCISIFWLTKFIKRIIPFKIGSEAFLNRISIWFMRKCVSPEAQEMLYRHFAIENSLVHFVINNCGASDISTVYLRPTKAEELGDTAGMNATLMHDAIILNLFVDLGRSVDADIHTTVPHEQLDFSGMEIPSFELHDNHSGRWLNLDLESTLYITVMILCLMLPDEIIENSVNSLNLDESLMCCLSNLTGDTTFRRWTLTPFTDIVRCPLDVTFELYKHIKIHEYAYYHLQQLKNLRYT